VPSKLLRECVRNSNLPGHKISFAVTVLQRNRTVRIVDDVTFGEVRRFSTVEVAAANMELELLRLTQRNIESAAEYPR
jgi:hypothetical protein